MTSRRTSLLPVALALAATGCADHADNADNPTCAMSLDDYCSRTGTPDCRYRDYDEALWEWNQQAMAAPTGSTSWGCAECGDYDVLAVDESAYELTTTRYFSRATGTLVAILQSSGNGQSPQCTAGPAHFTVPPCSNGGRCGWGAAPDGAIDGP